MRLFAILCLLGACAAAPDCRATPLADGELRLVDVDRLVAERNRTLLAARRARTAAEAATDIAAARPNPTVSLNTSSINTARSFGSSNLDTVLRIDQTIERGDKRALRLAVADNLLAASRADEADSLRQQRQLARQAFYDLKAAEQKALFAEEAAQLAGQLLAKAELRLQAGDLSPADVARIRTDSQRAAADATQAAIEHRRARLQLAQLLAIEGDAGRLRTAGDWPELTPLPSTVAVGERPDLIAARQRLAAAEQGVALARSQRVRDVTVGAQIEREKGERRGNLLGFGVSIPLFTGNDYRGDVARAIVDRDSARDELERVEAAIAAELAQLAFEADRLGERARRLRDEALPAARKAHAAMLFAFGQGAASTLDVIDARRSLYAVETDTAAALADAAKARVAWAAANQQELP